MRRFRRRTARPSRWRRFFDYALALSLLFVIGLLVLRMDRLSTVSLDGAVVVNDGDSLTLRGQRIRLWGIDAPELDQTCEAAGRVYQCGRQAKGALAELVAKGVRCEGWERDRYGRLLAECFAEGADINAAMVRSGWAVSYGGYADEEHAARRDASGLWAGTFEAPRNWRSRHGGMVETGHGLSDLAGRIGNWLGQVLGF